MRNVWTLVQYFILLVGKSLIFSFSQTKNSYKEIAFVKSFWLSIVYEQLNWNDADIFS